MGDILSTPVFDPVDEDAYPERPLSEAQAGVVQVNHHDAGDPNRVFVEHVVDEGGNSSFQLTEEAEAAGLKGVGSAPHKNYVENSDFYPGYRPPVYDEPVTTAGVPVAETEYDDWTLAKLKTEIEERNLDVDTDSVRSKKAAIEILEEDDQEQ